MIDYDLAARLLEARQRQGWTQRELSARSEVHFMAISRIERGDKKDVNGLTVRKLAIALGVTTDYLLSLSELPQRRGARPPALAVAGEVSHG